MASAVMASERSGATHNDNAKALASSLVDTLGATLSETRYQAVLAELTANTQQKVMSFALEAAVARDEDQLAEAAVNAFPQIVSGQSAFASLYVIHDQSDEDWDRQPSQEEEDEDKDEDDTELDVGEMEEGERQGRRDSMFSQESAVEETSVIRYSALGGFPYRRLSNSDITNLLGENPILSKSRSSFGGGASGNNYPYQSSPERDQGPLSSAELRSDWSKRRTGQVRIPLGTDGELKWYAHTRAHVLTKSSEISRYLDLTQQPIYQQSKLNAIMVIPCKTYYGKGLGWIEVQITSSPEHFYYSTESKHGADPEALTEIDIAVSKMMGTYLAAAIERLRSQQKTRQKLHAKSSDMNHLRKNLRTTTLRKRELEESAYLRAKLFEASLDCKGGVQKLYGITGSEWNLSAVARLCRQLSSHLVTDTEEERMPKFRYSLVCFGHDVSQWGEEVTLRRIPEWEGTDVAAWIPGEEYSATVKRIDLSSNSSFTAIAAGAQGAKWFNPEWSEDPRYNEDIDTCFVPPDVSMNSRLCLSPVFSSHGTNIAAIAAEVFTEGDHGIDLNSVELEDTITSNCMLIELCLQRALTSLQTTFLRGKTIMEQTQAAAALLHKMSKPLRKESTASKPRVPEWLHPRYPGLTDAALPEKCKLPKDASFLWKDVCKEVVSDCYGYLNSALEYINSVSLSLVAYDGKSTEQVAQFGEYSPLIQSERLGLCDNKTISYYRLTKSGHYRAVAESTVEEQALDWESLSLSRSPVLQESDENVFLGLSQITTIPHSENDDGSLKTLHMIIALKDTFSPGNVGYGDQMIALIAPAAIMHARSKMSEKVSMVTKRQFSVPHVTMENNSFEALGARHATLSAYQENSIGAAVYIADNSLATLHKTYSLMSEDPPISLETSLPPEISIANSDIFQCYQSKQVRCRVVHTIQADTGLVLQTVMPLFVPLEDVSTASTGATKVEVWGCVVIFQKWPAEDSFTELQRRIDLKWKLSLLAEDCLSQGKKVYSREKQLETVPDEAENFLRSNISPQSVQFVDRDIQASPYNEENVVSSIRDGEGTTYSETRVGSPQSFFSPKLDQQSPMDVRNRFTPDIGNATSTNIEHELDSFLARTCSAIDSECLLWFSRDGESRWRIAHSQIHPLSSDTQKAVYSRLFPGKVFNGLGRQLDMLLTSDSRIAGSASLSDLFRIDRDDVDFEIDSFLILPVDRNLQRFILGLNKVKKACDSDESTNRTRLEFNEKDVDSLATLFSPLQYELSFRNYQERAEELCSRKVERLNHLQNQYNDESVESMLHKQVLEYRKCLEYCSPLQFLWTENDIERFVRRDLTRLLNADACQLFTTGANEVDGGFIGNAVRDNRVIQFHTGQHNRSLSGQDVKALYATFQESPHSIRWSRPTNVMVFPVSCGRGGPAKDDSKGFVIACRAGDQSKRFSAAEMNICSSLGSQIFAAVSRSSFRKASIAASQSTEEHLKHTVETLNQRLKETEEVKNHTKEAYVHYVSSVANLRNQFTHILTQFSEVDCWKQILGKLQTEFTDENRVRLGQISAMFSSIAEYCQMETKGISVESLYLSPYEDYIEDCTSLCEVHMEKNSGRCICRWVVTANRPELQRVALVASQFESQTEKEHQDEILYWPVCLYDDSVPIAAVLKFRCVADSPLDSSHDLEPFLEKCNSIVQTLCEHVIKDCLINVLSDINTAVSDERSQLQSQLEEVEIELQTATNGLDYRGNIMESADDITGSMPDYNCEEVLSRHLRKFWSFERLIVLLPEVDSRYRFTGNWYSPSDPTIVVTEGRSVVGKFLLRSSTSSDHSLPFDCAACINNVSQTPDFDSSQDRLVENVNTLNMYLLSSEISLGKTDRSGMSTAALIVVNAHTSLESDPPAKFLLNLCGVAVKYMAEREWLNTAIQMHHEEEQMMRKYIGISQHEDSDVCPRRNLTNETSTHPSESTTLCKIAEKYRRLDYPSSVASIIEHLQRHVHVDAIDILVPEEVVFNHVQIIQRMSLGSNENDTEMSARPGSSRNNFIHWHVYMNIVNRCIENVSQLVHDLKAQPKELGGSLDVCLEIENEKVNLESTDPAVQVLDSLDSSHACVTLGNDVVAAFPLRTSALSPAHRDAFILRTSKSFEHLSHPHFSVGEKLLMATAAKSLTEPLSACSTALLLKHVSRWYDVLSSKASTTERQLGAQHERANAIERVLQVKEHFMELVVSWSAPFLKSICELTSSSHAFGGSEEALDGLISKYSEEVNVAHNEYGSSCVNGLSTFGKNILGADATLLWRKEKTEGRTFWTPFSGSYDNYRVGEEEQSLVGSCSNVASVLTCQSIYKDSRFHAKESHLLRDLIRETSGFEDLGSVVCIPLPLWENEKPAMILQCCWSDTKTGDELSQITSLAHENIDSYKESLVFPYTGQELFKNICTIMRSKQETEQDLQKLNEDFEQTREELEHYKGLQDTVSRSSFTIQELEGRVNTVQTCLEKYERTVTMLTGLLAAEGHEQALYKPLSPRAKSLIPSMNRGRPLEWVCHLLRDIVGAQSVRLLLHWNRPNSVEAGASTSVLVPITSVTAEKVQRPHLDFDDFEEFSLQTIIFDILGIKRDPGVPFENIFARSLALPEDGPVASSLANNACVNVDPLYVAESNKSMGRKHFEPVVTAPIRTYVGESSNPALNETKQSDRDSNQSFSVAKHISRGSQLQLTGAGQWNEAIMSKVAPGVFGVVEVVGKLHQDDREADDNSDESFSAQDVRFICAAADGISRYIEYYLASEVAQWYYETSEKNREEMERQAELADTTAKDLESLRETVDSLEQKTNHLEQVESEKNALEEKASGQEQALEQLERDNRKLEKRLKELKDASMKASYYDKQKNNELQQQLEKQQEEADRLRSELENLQNKKDSLKRQRSDLKYLLGLERQRLQKQEQEANEAKESLEDARQKLNELKGENSDQQEAINRLQRSLDSYEKSLDAALAEKKSLGEKVEENRRRWLGSDEEARNLRERVNDVANQLHRREKELHRAHDLIASLREELAAADKMASKAWRVPV